MASASDADTSPKSRPTSGAVLSEQAYRAVAELIRTRQLTGDEIVVEQCLADSLFISRTSLREALQRPGGQGLVIKAAVAPTRSAASTLRNTSRA